MAPKTVVRPIPHLRCFISCLGYRTEESDCDTWYVHFSARLFILFRFVSQNTVSLLPDSWMLLVLGQYSLLLLLSHDVETTDEQSDNVSANQGGKAVFQWNLLIHHLETSKNGPVIYIFFCVNKSDFWPLLSTSVSRLSLWPSAIILIQVLSGIPQITTSL